MVIGPGSAHFDGVRWFADVETLHLQQTQVFGVTNRAHDSRVHSHHSGHEF